MTVELPKSSRTDSFLKCFGRRRAVYIPDVGATYGPHVYIKAQKEPFLRTLLRRKDAPLPNGWVYLDTLIEEENTDAD